MTSIPNQLRQMREAAGMTTREAERALKMPEHTIDFYEAGSREPQMSTLRKLAKLYGYELVIEFKESK